MVEMNRKIKNKLNEAETMQEIGLLWSAQKKYERAKKWLKKASHVFKDIGAQTEAAQTEALVA